MQHYVYSSGLMADHPQAQKVGPRWEKARFERELVSTEDISCMRALARSSETPRFSTPAASRNPACRDEEEPNYRRPEHRKHRPAAQKETRQCR
jgi:hypothetical protein